MGDWGFKVSKPGKNVGTAGVEDLVFTSAKGVFGLRQVSTYTGTTDASGDIDATFNHSFGYTPICVVTTTSYDGKKVLVPNEWVSFGTVGEVEYTEWLNFRVGTGSFRMGVHIEGFDWATLEGTIPPARAYTFTVQYFFNKLGTAV